MKNQAVYMTAIKKLEIRDCEMPIAGEGELVISIKYVGICGSDSHFFEAGRIGKKVIDGPFVLGHECSGVVTEIGKNVTGFQVGDRVVLEPGIPCGVCEYCRIGKYNLCDDMKFKSSPPNDGFLSRYVKHPASMCYRLPDEISLVEGALIEPLAVGIHAAIRGGVQLGKSVVVLGAGTIGLMTIIACKAMSATRIIVTDVFETRLSLAKKLGADETINASSNKSEEEINILTQGEGVDIVFETAGSSVTMSQTAKIAKKGGKIVVVGNITSETNYDFLTIASREVDIFTVYRYRNIFQLAINSLFLKKINLKGVEPKMFSFENTQEAFIYAIENKKNIIKVMIKID